MSHRPATSTATRDDAIIELRAMVAALAERVRVLEAGRGPRDRYDEDVLLAIAETAVDTTFTAAELIAHAQANPRLSDALLAADINGAWALGRLLSRLTRAVGPLVLECIATERLGRRYVLRQRSS